MPDFLLQTFAIIKGNVIPALIVLTAVVFVHEMGHFLVARWCGIRVAAFSIGFGRELAGFTDRRGTRWKLSAIPLGGYVRFEGDDNAASIPDAEMLAQDPAVGAPRPVPFRPAVEARRRRGGRARSPISSWPSSSLRRSSPSSAARTSCRAAETVMPDSAAERAGIKPGDLIVSVDGARIDSFSKLQSIVMLSADDALTIEVDRNGERVTLQATPERQEQPDRLGGTHRIGVLGITAGEIDFRRDDPLTALGQGVAETGHIIERTMTYIGRLIRGREGTEQLSGVIRIGQVSGAVASNGGLPGLIYLTAVLSVSIGLFNLFPVPMLDGGHLLFYAIEALRGRPLSPRLQDLGFRIGFALVIMLFIFVTFNDIANLPGIFANS